MSEVSFGPQAGAVEAEPVRFAPGDRAIWTLPVLEAPNIADASIRASDWLETLQPLLSDLSPGSGQYWEAIREAAFEAYTRWQNAAPLERVTLTPSMPTRFIGQDLPA